MRVIFAAALIALALPSSAQAVCAAYVEWRGAEYDGYATKERVPYESELGPFVIPPCRDVVALGPDGETLELDEESPQHVTLAKIVGVDPAIAVAVVGDTHTIYIRDGVSFETAVLARFFSAPPVTGRERPADVATSGGAEPAEARAWALTGATALVVLLGLGAWRTGQRVAGR